MVTDMGGPRIASTSSDVWPLVTPIGGAADAFSMATDWLGVGTASSVVEVGSTPAGHEVSLAGLPRPLLRP